LELANADGRVKREVSSKEEELEKSRSFREQGKNEDMEEKRRKFSFGKRKFMFGKRKFYFGKRDAEIQAMLENINKEEKRKFTFGKRKFVFGKREAEGGSKFQFGRDDEQEEDKFADIEHKVAFREPSAIGDFKDIHKKHQFSGDARPITINKEQKDLQHVTAQ